MFTARKFIIYSRIDSRRAFRILLRRSRKFIRILRVRVRPTLLTASRNALFIAQALNSGRETRFFESKLTVRGKCAFESSYKKNGAYNVYNSRAIKWKPGIAVFHVDKLRLRNESGGAQKDAPRPRSVFAIDARRTINDTARKGSTISGKLIFSNCRSKTIKSYGGNILSLLPSSPSLQVTLRRQYLSCVRQLSYGIFQRLTSRRFV